MPVISWTIFSIYYYGFLFPNTAYAKLATGISLADRIIQGQAYFLHFAHTDPLSCLTILVGVLFGFVRRSYFSISISVGILLYLVYILSIGGDFMGGRFFTAPLLMATIQIARFSMSNRHVALFAILILIIGFFNIKQTVLSGKSYSNSHITNAGIADERGFNYQKQGLLTGKADGIFLMREWSIGKKEVQVMCGSLGFTSLQAGPSTHFIDTCALTDPLLSRLPAISSYKQRVGHYVRELPAGYKESAVSGINLVEDTRTRDLYESIRFITRGELNDLNRLKQISSVNLNPLQMGIDKPSQQSYRHELDLGETIFFNKNSKGNLILRDGSSSNLLPNNGWGGPEDWGVWAIGNKARLSLPIPVHELPQTLYLDVQLLVSPVIKYQTVNVYKVVEGSAVKDFFRLFNRRNKLVVSVKSEASDSNILKSARIAIPIDQNMINERKVSLEFVFPTSIRPKNINLSDDERELSMGLISAVFR